MPTDSEDDVPPAESDGADVKEIFDIDTDEADEESSREIQLVEDDSGFWTLVDSEKGAVGDAPDKATGLVLMEQYLEDMEGVSFPDVEPEEPSEQQRDRPTLPNPSVPEDAETADEE